MERDPDHLAPKPLISAFNTRRDLQTTSQHPPIGPFHPLFAIPTQYLAAPCSIFGTTTIMSRTQTAAHRNVLRPVSVIARSRPCLSCNRSLLGFMQSLPVVLEATSLALRLESLRTLPQVRLALHPSTAFAGRAWWKMQDQACWLISASS